VHQHRPDRAPGRQPQPGPAAAGDVRLALKGARGVLGRGQPGVPGQLVLHPRDDLLRAARADWACTGLRKDYTAWRPSVERAVAQVATWRGRRLKLRYRGTARNHARLKLRIAALNLRTLIGRGLARRDGAWALAT
jgi:hypothetical protein